jgi:uncharacterized protein YndB with AHSA1/START domain
MAGEIRKTILINAPPNTVFKALTDEKELTKWFPDQARLESKVGGLVQFKFFEDGKENHRVEGKVLEVIPNKKISYSWKNTSDPDFPNTTVTWTLEEAGGKTKLTLVHAGFDPKSKWHELHSMGWSYFIEDRLVEYCSGKPMSARKKFS